MQTGVLGFAMVALCLAVGASACGGDDDDDLSAESVAAVDQVQAICDEWRSKLEARGEFPVKDFDPEDPDPEDLRRVGNYFASGQSTSAEGITALRELPVPTEIEARVDALVAALERDFETQKTQHSAAQAGDVVAFKATLEDAASTETRREGCRRRPRCAGVLDLASS